MHSRLEQHVHVSRPNGTKVYVIEDSVAPHGGRLTTLLCRYHRFIHSEVMTHRVFSRNAASSRAIPVRKVLQQVREDPALPIWWGKNQKGMQAKEELSEEHREVALSRWLFLRDQALSVVEDLHDIELHKQLANRPLELWAWMWTLVTATEWDNHDNLRDNEEAQPEYHVLAGAMVEARKLSKPRLLKLGEFHLPFVLEEERGGDTKTLLKYSTARCCRTSYANFDGTIDLEKDIAQHDDLLAKGHMSPFEHQATPAVQPDKWSGNFQGYIQYRKTIPGEAVFRKTA